MATRREALDRLVEQARNDPQFFHGLVFEPELTLAKVDYLDRREKGMIVGIAPEDVIAGLAGLGIDPGGHLIQCTNSCSDSCLDTCGGSCGRTCDSSCMRTCGSQSCGATTALVMAPDVDDLPPLQNQFGRGRRIFRPFRR